MKKVAIGLVVLSLVIHTQALAQNLRIKEIHNLFSDDLGERGRILYQAVGSRSGFFQHPAWSPDGSKIAFDFTVYDRPLSIWIANSDGTGLTKVSIGDDEHPSWSPMGDRIAFARENMVSNKSEIWIMNADGSNQVFLAEGFVPAWSSNGKIAFIGQDASGNNDIWITNQDRTGLTKLTSTPEREMDVSWSHDGHQIAYTQDRNGMLNIWIMNADGTNQRQLTTKGGMAPSWSPDGRWIAFESDRRGELGDLWVERSDRVEEVIHLRTGFEAAGKPSWSPDGRKIVFEGVRKLKVDDGLYIMTLQ